MLSCPNKNDPRWKQMVDVLGENEAYYYFNLNEGFVSDEGVLDLLQNKLYEVTFTENYNDYRGEYEPIVNHYYFNTKREADLFFPDEYKERRAGEWPTPRLEYSKQVNEIDSTNQKIVNVLQSRAKRAKIHKKYELSKQAVEKWKAENNIVYNPEEVYSRGQEFVSVLNAYSKLKIDKTLENLLEHIKINTKLGAGFTLSTFTRPVGNTRNYLEHKRKGLIRFKVYPKSEDILWAADTDVVSGSVWDSSEDFGVDPEFAGVSYVKYPALDRLDHVQPNLANVIDNLEQGYNEVAVNLTTNNFKIEYEDDVDQSTKDIIDSINAQIGKITLPTYSTNNPIKGRQVTARPETPVEQYFIESFKIEQATNGQYLIISERDDDIVDVVNSKDDAVKSVRRLISKKTPQEELNAKIVAHKKYNDLRIAENIMSENSDSDEKLYYSTVKEAIGNEIPLEVWKSLTEEEQTKIINCL